MCTNTISNTFDPCDFYVFTDLFHARIDDSNEGRHKKNVREGEMQRKREGRREEK